MVGQRLQHAASTSAYLALSCARWYPSSSSHLVHMSTVSPDFFYIFLFPSWGFQMVICDVHWLPGILLICPAQVNYSLLTYSITSVTFVFSLSQMFVFLSWYVTFNILLYIFVCAAGSLVFAWVVSAHVYVL